MPSVNWRAHLVADPAIHHGDLCVRGTRIPVIILMSSLADGMSSEQIIASYPQLTQQHIQAVLAYAAEVLEAEALLPLMS